MVSFSIFLFIMGAVFLMTGIRLKRGSMTLIKDKPENKKNAKKNLKKTKKQIAKELEYKHAYGREFSKGMFIVAAFMVASGVFALFIDSTIGIVITLVGVFAGSIVGAGYMLRAYNKYEK